MSAQRYTIRLHWRSRQERQCDTNIDPTDNQALRDRLESMVKAARGTLDLDLSEWSVTVHSLGGGMVRAKCRVSPSGETEVTR